VDGICVRGASIEMPYCISAIVVIACESHGGIVAPDCICEIRVVEKCSISSRDIQRELGIVSRNGVQICKLTSHTAKSENCRATSLFRHLFREVLCTTPCVRTLVPEPCFHTGVRSSETRRRYRRHVCTGGIVQAMFGDRSVLMVFNGVASSAHTFQTSECLIVMRLTTRTSSRRLVAAQHAAPASGLRMKMSVRAFTSQTETLAWSKFL